MCTILIVDDEEMIAELTAEILRDMGYKTLEAHSGHAALQILEQQPVNVVISDIRMPKMTGLQLLAQIRARPGKPLPVILITGYADVSETQAMAAGAQAMISKPPEFDLLLAEVKRACAC